MEMLCFSGSLELVGKYQHVEARCNKKKRKKRQTPTNPPLGLLTVSQSQASRVLLFMTLPPLKLALTSLTHAKVVNALEKLHSIGAKASR